MRTLASSAYPNELVAIIKGMRALKLCSNKILQLYVHWANPVMFYGLRAGWLIPTYPKVRILQFLTEAAG